MPASATADGDAAPVWTGASIRSSASLAVNFAIGVPFLLAGLAWFLPHAPRTPAVATA